MNFQVTVSDGQMTGGLSSNVRRSHLLLAILKSIMVCLMVFISSICMYRCFCVKLQGKTGRIAPVTKRYGKWINTYADKDDER